MLRRAIHEKNFQTKSRINLIYYENNAQFRIQYWNGAVFCERTFETPSTVLFCNWVRRRNKNWIFCHVLKLQSRAVIGINSVFFAKNPRPSLLRGDNPIFSMFFGNGKSLMYFELKSSCEETSLFAVIFSSTELMF